MGAEPGRSAIYAPPEKQVPAATAVSPDAALLESAPPGPVSADDRPAICAETFGRAVEHGDEHVIKFADTAIEVFGRTGNPDAIAAARRAMDLIGR